VILSRDAISLSARLLTTASSTSLCRALKDVGQAIAGPPGLTYAMTYEDR
jgi:hypothetical protein